MGIPRLLGDGAAEIRAHPKRFFVGLLLGLLPLLSVLMVGYATKIIRKSAANGYPTLPAWWNWKQLFVDGLKVGLLLAVFNVPFFALALVVQSLGTLAGELVTTLLTLLLIAAALIPAVMFLSAWKRMALTGSFKKALDLRRAWGEASQPAFWRPALKCLGAGVALLAVGRLLGFYGLPFAAASYVFLLLLAWWLGATSIEGKTPVLTDKPKKSGFGGSGRKLTLALVALLVLGIATPFLAHIEPLELPVTQEINIFGDSIKVTAPSYWQYYWLDAEHLELVARVNETEHNHGWQEHKYPLGDTTKNTYQSWCDTTVVQTFSPEKARLYQHEQCHELDDPTDACFYLYETGFGTTGEFFLSIVKFAVGQGMKALTGQFTPAGIAVDAMLNVVGQIINSVAGLGDNTGRPTGPIVGETAGACLEAGLGENPLGQEKGMWKVKDAIKDAFKKKGVDIGKSGGFISGVGLGMITDLITDLVMKLVREMLEAAGVGGRWLLADGCANIAQTDHVDLRQSDPELWQFTGRVDVSKLFIPTGRYCSPTTISPPTGTTTGDPGNPPKTVDTIPKPPLTPDPWEPPIVDGPPLQPPIGEPPPAPPETPGGGIKCTNDQDCYDIDQYYCSGLVAHADMGTCVKGQCGVIKQSRDCDDQKESTEDLCEASKTDVKCINRPKCGNGKVDSGETCSTCAKDVKCGADQYCDAGVCKDIPCKNEGGDSDNDGTCDNVDNCKDIPNDQSDLDGDGTGDVCDEAPINCGGWAAESGHESFSSGWTTPGTEAAAKSFCVQEMWKGVDKPVCMTTCLKVFVSVYMTPNNVFTCCARSVSRIACSDCPGQHPVCYECGKEYDSWIGGGGSETPVPN